MKCPLCASTDNKVVDSRVAKESDSIRRRRQCLDCNHRFNTIEEVRNEGLTVLKRDGGREEFDRNKMVDGIRKATIKRPLDVEQIDLLVNDVIEDLIKEYDYEIPTQAIGQSIVSRLKNIDPIAYVRFLCVYKDFRDLDELMKELSQLNP